MIFFLQKKGCKNTSYLEKKRIFLSQADRPIYLMFETDKVAGLSSPDYHLCYPNKSNKSFAFY